MNSRDSRSSAKLSSDITRFCVIDVGSTTTKVFLFKRGTDWQYLFREEATTVEKPFEDVTVGVTNAMRVLETETGETLLREGVPCIPLYSSSSAGGGLAVVVAGLMRDVTARSAERVALGAGSVIQEVISLDDDRTPYKKIEILKTLRPDMLLLAGGFDGGAMHGPVFLAEVISQSDLRPKLCREEKLPVIYAGNADATRHVEEILGERFLFHEVPNLRPASDRENLEPARNAIHDVFMRHVMSRAPGYEKYTTWVSAPILPTPAAVGKLLALVSKDLQAKILAIDIGGATTDVFTADHGKVFRTVSANLGMSYSILNVVKQASLAAVQELLDLEITDRELLNRLGNKFLRPTGLPENTEDTIIECAMAATAIREAVSEHLQVMHGVSLSLSKEELGWHMFRKRTKVKKSTRRQLCLPDYDMVIGSGGKLSHSPRDATAMILLNALEPGGSVQLAVDRAFMFPHLGVLSEVDEGLALDLFYRFGLVKLGKVVAPTGRAKPGKDVLQIEGVTSRSRKISERVKFGEVRLLHLDEGESAEFDIKPKGVSLAETSLSVNGQSRGLVVDARGRPAVGRTGFLIPDGHRPSPRDLVVGMREPSYHGDIQVTRELAIPGEVFVKPGDVVSPETIVAKSTNAFLRPFFLRIAEEIGCPPGDLKSFLGKRVGEEVAKGEVIAERKAGPLEHKRFRSPVWGTVERILPTGTVVVREKAELAGKLHAVKVAEELDVRPDKIRPYLRCEVGQEIEKGQWVAVVSMPNRVCRSPIRGVVKQINVEFGAVLIEPLLEELELSAWMPGKVDSVTDRGCVIVNKGTVISGVWGNGSQVFGDLAFDEADSGHIVVKDAVDRDYLSLLDTRNVRGLITGGLNLADYEEVNPGYAVVVTEEFGARELDPEIRDVLYTRRGELAVLDARTQLRAGVQRPQVIIPESLAAR